jgi:protein-L-isoaspartate(D-aspartate) O-methyltransferase
MNFEQARFNMIEQQIRTWEVLDPHVLELLGEVKREEFVPERYRKLAFADMQIPLGHGQVMMEPKVEARLLQELALRPTDRVLEVGTGSGYVTALLAHMAGSVFSVEIVPELSLAAQERLAAHGIDNVQLEIGDAAAGWARHAPYDAILLTGSVPLMPQAFPDSLAPGGRLAAVVGRAPAMEAIVVERLKDGGFARRSLFETVIPPLVNADAPAEFVF